MSAWRPIETAPKDGTPFLAWAPGYKWPEVLRWFQYDAEDALEVGEEGYFHFAEELLQDACDAPDIASDYSHWQPLPEPPTKEGETQP